MAANVHRPRDVKRQIEALFDELLAHDGYGSLTIEMRLLRRGQKEVILHCGKQYRYVLDFSPARAPDESYGDGEGPCASIAEHKGSAA